MEQSFILMSTCCKAAYSKIQDRITVLLQCTISHTRNTPSLLIRTKMIESHGYTDRYTDPYIKIKIYLAINSLLLICISRRLSHLIGAGAPFSHRLFLLKKYAYLSCKWQSDRGCVVAYLLFRSFDSV